MSTISNCTLDTADSVTSILNLKKIENIVINLSDVFNKLDVQVHNEPEESIIESNDI